MPYNRAMNTHDVIILGGGASGLYCAIHAGRTGLRVAVVDHKKKPAAKVRISGGGRCNFTNTAASATHYISANPHFVKSALARHTPWDVVAFFAEHGLEYEEKAAGQLFCVQGAPRLAGTLLEQAHRAGAELRFDTRIMSVDRADGFTVNTRDGALTAPRLVLALGGPSWPETGATDLGFTLAKQFGLEIVPPLPGLVGLVLKGKESDFCNGLAGTALPVAVQCGPVRFTDDMLFTHRGVSGPAMLQISSYWRKGEALTVDLMPSESVISLLSSNRTRNVAIIKILAERLPSRLVAALLPPALATTPASQVSAKQAEELAGLIHHWTVHPTTTEGYAKAEVTLGGIDTAGVSSKTMEAREVPGLYAIGECLDVTGQLGGFNLHWAWASGYCCAEAMTGSG